MMIHDVGRGDVIGNIASSEFYYITALATSNVDRCHRAALKLGEGQEDIVKQFGVQAAGQDKTPDTRHKGLIRDSPMHQKVPISKSASYQLKKARIIAQGHRKKDTSQSGVDSVEVDAFQSQLQYLSKVNRATAIRGSHGATRTKAQALAGDDGMSPLMKLELVRDEIQRLTNPPKAPHLGTEGESGPRKNKSHRDEHSMASTAFVDWDLLNEYLIIQSALCRLLYGDWSMECAEAEYALSASYVLLGQPLVAQDHAAAARKAAHAVLDRSPLIEVKIDLVEATAITLARTESEMSKAVHLSSRAIDAYKRIEGCDNDSPLLFPFYFVKTNALFLEGSAHQRALDSLDDALRCCTMRAEPNWSDVFQIHTIKLAVHLDLLSRVAQELMAMPAKSSKEKVHSQLAEVSTRDELALVHQQLTNDLSALNEKRKSLQLTLVRQSNYVKAELQNALQNWIPASPDDEDAVTPVDILPMARIIHSASRALWVGQQLPLAGQLATLATTLLKATLGAQDPVTLQAEVDKAILLTESASVPSITFLSSWQQRCHPLDTTSTAMTSATDVTILRSKYATAVKAICRTDAKEARKKVGHEKEADSDSDSDGSVESSISRNDDREEVDEADAVDQRERACAELEAVLLQVCSSFGPTSTTAHTISIALERAYHRMGLSAKEMQHTALLCDIYAVLLGPTHGKTIQKLAEFEKKRSKVHAPLFSPSWGVQRLLAEITLSTASPGAEIYFTTSGEVPTEDPGVNSSMVYTGPIVLDTLGRVTVKAIAVKDGKRSGAVEAKYSVMRK